MHVFTCEKELNLEDEWRTGHWSVSPQNSYAGALILSVTVLGDKEVRLHEVLGVGLWSDQTADLISRRDTGAPLETDTEAHCTEERLWGHSRKAERVFSPGTNPAGTLILGVHPPEEWENQHPLFKSFNTWCVTVANLANRHIQRKTSSPFSRWQRPVSPLSITFLISYITLHRSAPAPLVTSSLLSGIPLLQGL